MLWPLILQNSSPYLTKKWEASAGCHSCLPQPPLWSGHHLRNTLHKPSLHLLRWRLWFFHRIHCRNLAESKRRQMRLRRENLSPLSCWQAHPTPFFFPSAKIRVFTQSSNFPPANTFVPSIFQLMLHYFPYTTLPSLSQYTSMFRAVLHSFPYTIIPSTIAFPTRYQQSPTCASLFFHIPHYHRYPQDTSMFRAVLHSFQYHNTKYHCLAIRYQQSPSAKACFNSILQYPISKYVLLAQSSNFPSANTCFQLNLTISH